MKTQQLIKHIENLDFENFQKDWNLIKEQSTQEQRQKLLLEIVEWHYHKANHKFLEKVFDEILKINTNLDFSIEHWAPTFLSLLVFHNNKMLLQYFIRNGANINFIGDSCYNLTETEIDANREFYEPRHETCLDFAYEKYYNMLGHEYDFYPSYEPIENRRDEENVLEKIEITKGEYFDLIEQALYLQELIQMDRIVDYIKSIGGKAYDEIH